MSEPFWRGTYSSSVILKPPPTMASRMSGRGKSKLVISSPVTCGVLSDEAIWCSFAMIFADCMLFDNLLTRICRCNDEEDVESGP